MVNIWPVLQERIIGRRIFIMLVKAKIYFSILKKRPANLEITKPDAGISYQECFLLIQEQYPFYRGTFEPFIYFQYRLQRILIRHHSDSDCIFRKDGNIKELNSKIYFA